MDLFRPPRESVSQFPARFHFDDARTYVRTYVVKTTSHKPRVVIDFHGGKKRPPTHPGNERTIEKRKIFFLCSMSGDVSRLVCVNSIHGTDVRMCKQYETLGRSMLHPRVHPSIRPLWMMRVASWMIRFIRFGDSIRAAASRVAGRENNQRACLIYLTLGRCGGGGKRRVGFVGDLGDDGTRLSERFFLKF